MYTPDFSHVVATAPNMFHSVNGVGIDPMQNVEAGEVFYVRPSKDVVYVVESAAGCTFRVTAYLDDQGIPVTNTSSNADASIGAGETWLMGPFPPEGFAGERGLVEITVFGGSCTMFGIHMRPASGGGGSGDDANQPANSQLLPDLQVGGVLINQVPMERIDNQFSALLSSGGHCDLSTRGVLLLLNGDSSAGQLLLGANDVAAPSGRRLFYQTRQTAIGQILVAGPYSQRSFADTNGWIGIQAGPGVTAITAWSGLRVSL